MVLIKNTNAIGLDSIDKEPDVEVSREVLNEIKDWVRSVEFNDNDMSDMHRVKEFGDYVVDREHFHGHEDDVTITHKDNLACVKLSEFLEI